MKTFTALIGGAAVFASLASGMVIRAASNATSVKGFDISHFQPTVDFVKAYSDGARFVIIKATEGSTYKDAKFGSHFSGATAAGFIRGGYHFAQPASSGGDVQAKFFIANGGGWTADGKTLPGMLDLEYGKSAACYGLSPAAMVTWITAFSDTYNAATGRRPLIYTSTSWWSLCTGNSAAFANSPLVIARYASTVGGLPAGWGAYTIWQNSEKSPWGGDNDIFNGGIAQLQSIAQG